VIVFGTAVTDSETYDRCAAPGIRRAAEPDSKVLVHHTAGSVFRNYNVLLDKASAHEDLEALVLLHQDVELVDSDFAATLREALDDPEVAIVGCVGAVGVRSLAWWQGALTWAGLTHRYPEYGGGDFPGISWRPEMAPSYANTGEVDSVDGFVLVLSPWAVRNLRFDESLGKLHGYDYDICMQARAAGKKVATAEFRAVHHHSLELINDPETWIQTHIRLAEKWHDHLPDTGAEPLARARRAEAEAACAKAIMVAHQMRASAAGRHLARVQQELDLSRSELSEAREQLDAARRELRSDGTGRAQAAGPVQTGGPPAAKARAIDYVVDQLGIESFASLEHGSDYGQYAFYTIDKPEVQRGALVDLSPGRAGDQLLNVIEQAAERPGMEVLDSSFADPDTVTCLGQVDAILLFDVLLAMVDPDWDQVLEMYAPATSCFVIGNPQWELAETTVRLVDLGRERYLEAVPPGRFHTELFDRLDEWHPGQHRPYRDTRGIWQWGITDADLVAKLDELGFSLKHEWSLTPPVQTKGFLNKAFVFTRFE
jgi:GT2 family glycosyltransferase